MKRLISELNSNIKKPKSIISTGDPPPTKTNDVDEQLKFLMNVFTSNSGKPRKPTFEEKYSDWYGGANFEKKINQVSKNLNIPVRTLKNMILFESTGDSGKKTTHGSATGLIQFLKGTSESLGADHSKLPEMTPAQQLDYVEKYLSGIKNDFKLGDEDLADPVNTYLSVFYPSAIKKADDYIIGSDENNSAERIAQIAKNNPSFSSGKEMITKADIRRSIENNFKTIESNESNYAFSPIVNKDIRYLVKDAGYNLQELREMSHGQSSPIKHLSNIAYEERNKSDQNIVQNFRMGGQIPDKKVMKARNMRKGNIQIPGEENPSSHFMAHGTADGKHIVHPTLFQTDKGHWYSAKNPFKEAKKRNEVITFNSESEAKEFAEGSWKPRNMKKKYKFNPNMIRFLDADGNEKTLGGVIESISPMLSAFGPVGEAIQPVMQTTGAVISNREQENDIYEQKVRDIRRVKTDNNPFMRKGGFINYNAPSHEMGGQYVDAHGNPTNDPSKAVAEIEKQEVSAKIRNRPYVFSDKLINSRTGKTMAATAKKIDNDTVGDEMAENHKRFLAAENEKQKQAVGQVIDDFEKNLGGVAEMVQNGSVGFGDALFGLANRNTPVGIGASDYFKTPEAIVTAPKDQSTFGPKPKTTSEMFYPALTSQQNQSDLAPYYGKSRTDKFAKTYNPFSGAGDRLNNKFASFNSNDPTGESKLANIPTRMDPLSPLSNNLNNGFDEAAESTKAAIANGQEDSKFNFSKLFGTDETLQDYMKSGGKYKIPALIHSAFRALNRDPEPDPIFTDYSKSDAYMNDVKPVSLDELENVINLQANSMMNQARGSSSSAQGFAAMAGNIGSRTMRAKADASMKQAESANRVNATKANYEQNKALDDKTTRQQNRQERWRQRAAEDMESSAFFDNMSRFGTEISRHEAMEDQAEDVRKMNDLQLVTWSETMKEIYPNFEYDAEKIIELKRKYGNDPEMFQKEFSKLMKYIPYKAEE